MTECAQLAAASEPKSGIVIVAWP